MGQYLRWQLTHRFLAALPKIDILEIYGDYWRIKEFGEFNTVRRTC
jgi:hypothetical protein